MTRRPAKQVGAPVAWKAALRRAIGPLIFVALAINVVDWAITARHPGVDFSIFHRTALRFLNGEGLYPAADHIEAYKYAPAIAVFFVPFSRLPVRVGWTVLNLLSAGCITLSMCWASRRVRPDFRPLAHVIVLVVIYPFAVQIFRIGQVDGLLLALVISSEALAGTSPGASGLLWATAAAAKTPFLILAAPALVQRQWRRLIAFAVGCIAWLALGIGRKGWGAGLDELARWRDLLQRT
jgi:hypothetical protein